MRGVLAFLLLVGCSHPARSPHGNGDPKAPDAGVEPAPTPDAAPPDAPVTEAECDQWIDHVLDLANSETYATLPPEERAAARADAHAKFRTDYIDQCLQFTRADYECLLAAPDRDAMIACGI